MNLHESSIWYWEELYHPFVSNLEGTYPSLAQSPTSMSFNNNLVNLCVLLLGGEKTIPRGSVALVIVSFYHGVHNEKMVKKVATHNIHDIKELLSPVDKSLCVLLMMEHGTLPMGWSLGCWALRHPNQALREEKEVQQFWGKFVLPKRMTSNPSKEKNSSTQHLKALGSSTPFIGPPPMT